MEDLPTSEALPYIGWTITYNNSNWTEVYHNLQKSRRLWGMVTRVLEKTGATVQAQGAMYKAVAQLVLLYSSNIWVAALDMLKVLEGFHHRAAQQITGMTSNRGAGKDWDYPSVVEAMEGAGLQPIGEYIRRRQVTIVERV